jgi:hypothetical protein
MDANFVVRPSVLTYFILGSNIVYFKLLMSISRYIYALLIIPQSSLPSFLGYGPSGFQPAEKHVLS